MKRGVDQPYLVGKKIYLRLLNKKDINRRYLSWLNDSEVTKYMETGIFPVTQKDLENFYENISKDKNNVMFAIVIKQTNAHIGNIRLGDINWIHRFGNLGIMIGEKKYWGKGYGQEACRLLLEYAFNKLNLNKVTLGIYANHRLAIKAYQKAGFTVEGRLKRMLHLDGKYVDKIMMGILKNDFDKKIFPR